MLPCPLVVVMNPGPCPAHPSSDTTLHMDSGLRGPVESQMPLPTRVNDSEEELLHSSKSFQVSEI